MPLYPVDPQQRIWKWKSGSAFGSQGAELFICSHGGWNHFSTIQVPQGATVRFWCAEGATITAGECYQIMSGNPAHGPVQDVMAPNTVNDYTLSEFPKDWMDAIAAAKESGLPYDVAMILNANTSRLSPVHLSDVLKWCPGYYRYNFMACRVDMVKELMKKLFG